jgi:hypothetical protein
MNYIKTVSLLTFILGAHLMIAQYSPVHHKKLDSLSSDLRLGAPFEDGAFRHGSRGPSLKPIFCRWEDAIESKSKVPFRFRLGTLEYVDQMESKIRVLR